MHSGFISLSRTLLVISRIRCKKCKKNVFRVYPSENHQNNCQQMQIFGKNAANLVNEFWRMSLKCPHQMPEFTCKMRHLQFRLGFRPDPAGGAYSALQSPDPSLSWWERAGCPLPRTAPSSRPFEPQHSLTMTMAMILFYFYSPWPNLRVLIQLLPGTYKFIRIVNNFWSYPVDRYGILEFNVPFDTI